MRKIIIGCGYLGGRVAQKWVDAGHDVFALTRSDQKARRLRDRGIRPIIGDVTVPGTLGSLPEADTLLYSVGFDRHGGLSRSTVQIGGIENVLNAISAKVSHFIYISSTSVYGQTQGEWVDENSACTPKRQNGKVARKVEQSLFRQRAAHASTNELRTNVLRLSGIYGPGRLDARIEALTTGEPVNVNPDAWLNLIHADDAVLAILECHQKGGPKSIYVISDDRPIRRGEFYETLAAEVGAPAPEFCSPGPNDSRFVGLNKRCRNRAMREELGVELTYPDFASGLSSALPKSRSFRRPE